VNLEAERGRPLSSVIQADRGSSTLCWSNPRKWAEGDDSWQGEKKRRRNPEKETESKRKQRGKWEGTENRQTQDTISPDFIDGEFKHFS